MTADGLSAIAGVVLSLVFSYVPGIKCWFETLESQEKQALMGVLLVIVALGVFGVSCARVIDTGIGCTQGGAIGLVQVLIAALVSNQSTYLLTKE